MSTAKHTMTVLWVIVANSSFAQIYEVKGYGKEIKELQIIENPNGRKKPSEINTDKPGRAFDRLGGGRHSLGSVVDPHTHEVKVFVHKIADLLHKAKGNNDFDELALIAPPEFIGQLNLVLTENVKKILIKEIKKDLPNHLSEKDRKDQIFKYLEL